MESAESVGEKSLLENATLKQLESILVASWRTERKEQAEGINLKILERAEKDEDFRKQCLEGFDRMMHNAKFFAPHKGLKGKNIAILGAKNPIVGQWDPSSVKKGLTGSEEAVVYASDVLAKLGYRVHVYMDPPTNSLWRLPCENPVYKDCDLYTRDSDEFDAVIVWRHTQFHIAQQRSKNVFYWPHDVATHPFNVSALKGIFYLSEYHRKQMTGVCPALCPVPYVISGNGICLDHFKTPKSFTNPYSCIYASNYARGLALLLEIWPEIRKEFPTATLDIYYGRQTWGTMSKENEQALIKRLEDMKELGVTEKGMVGHQELADAMQNASVLTYPCNVESETFCITAVKAQAAGMVPVTTRIGALRETVHPKAPTLDKMNKPKDYRDKLIGVLRRIEKAGLSRDDYIAFAHTYTWDACVSKWLTLADPSPASSVLDFILSHWERIIILIQYSAFLLR